MRQLQEGEGKSGESWPPGRTGADLLGLPRADLALEQVRALWRVPQSRQQSGTVQKKKGGSP